MNYDLLLFLLILVVIIVMVYFLFPRIWQSISWAGHKLYSAISSAGRGLTKDINKAGQEITKDINAAGHSIYKSLSVAGHEVEHAVTEPVKAFANWESYMKKQEVKGLETARKDIEKSFTNFDKEVQHAGNWVKAGFKEYSHLWQKGANDIKKGVEGLEKETEKKLRTSIFHVVKRWKL